jgi:hypothetical protein
MLPVAAGSGLNDPGYSNASSVNATTAAGLSQEILKKSRELR